MALEEATLQIQGAATDPVLVMEAGRYGEPILVGLLTQENLLEFLMLTQLQNRAINRPYP